MVARDGIEPPPNRKLDSFDFTFNPKMNRSLVFDLATGGFIAKREDALFQGYRVFYREVHVLLDELADAVAEGTRKQYLASLAAFPLLIIDDFGMRKLPLTAAEDLLEIIMRRYERTRTLLTSNRLCCAPHTGLMRSPFLCGLRVLLEVPGRHFAIVLLRILCLSDH